MNYRFSLLPALVGLFKGKTNKENNFECGGKNGNKKFIDEFLLEKFWRSSLNVKKILNKDERTCYNQYTNEKYKNNFKNRKCDGYIQVQVIDVLVGCDLIVI